MCLPSSGGVAFCRLPAGASAIFSVTTPTVRYLAGATYVPEYPPCRPRHSYDLLFCPPCDT